VKDLIKIYSIRAGLPILKIYWRIFKPHTFGAKVLIINNDDDQKILLVKHSYGDRKVWSLPGGGYNPKHETAEAAAIRETREELDVGISDVKLLGERIAAAEGKIDTVTLFTATLKPASEIKKTYEIEEVSWHNHKEAFLEDDVDQMVKDTIKMTYNI
jgi:8-oxo-dGTP diphosphatase